MSSSRVKRATGVPFMRGDRTASTGIWESITARRPNRRGEQGMKLDLLGFNQCLSDGHLIEGLKLRGTRPRPHYIKTYGGVERLHRRMGQEFVIRLDPIGEVA